jgi:hypothetical protein
VESIHAPDLRIRFFSLNLYRRYPWDVKFQNSEYEMHQVGPKDYGSQNFRFLALSAEAVGEAKILCSAAATARDRRKKIVAEIILFLHKKF